MGCAGTRRFQKSLHLTTVAALSLRVTAFPALVGLCHQSIALLPSPCALPKLLSSTELPPRGAAPTCCRQLRLPDGENRLGARGLVSSTCTQIASFGGSDGEREEKNHPARFLSVIP